MDGLRQFIRTFPHTLDEIESADGTRRIVEVMHRRIAASPRRLRMGS